ncbi:MAG: 30S ribosomal protein S6 [Candidatus Kerfeldbacteria bacterium RIFCSPLOWO2_01_FULL_48_11]|uniref:Small ribosomal subunit protein bS6 n=1 Tax=Candidatus Kerfeldbacteria bacterium RIFCSPLOWO2_01_FULL_48_11 TaxID=1798543 RepID=A0A1G2B6T2_9BACT|nr:MAG: 30S ribosomal protein S6 [Parcubacteria group bacterium GW2011_GWA2_48_9]KKW16536.1 MAG: 30S ribosomal protein S6 [Parcubacteria group bacterium GW2011_GWC2_49_9]OGY83960.1 MAG: 30S ribosomal protein S6 [Candidatus Kerfeldbacteria bacterium RIFCSPLOWO2_01_FULL_48_11]HCJ52752.1 30S ribosomal protein S6 [Candidatus Kerfeldbacteria bacterium]HCM68760.1 30S ribosomal protein S6 [Candidatus Kerfeldbacteria bacterium]
MLQHYEMLFLLSGRKAQDELEKEVQEVFAILEKAGAAITKKEVFAKQRLAYRIKKEDQGVYILSEFDLETAKKPALDAELRHVPVLLRHQILVKAVKSPERMEEERLLRERVASKRVSQAQRVKEEERTQTVREEKAVEEKKKEKIDIEELDKKLEEILEDPVLKQ